MPNSYVVETNLKELTGKGVENPIKRQIYALRSARGFMRSKEGSIRVNKEAVKGRRKNDLQLRVSRKDVVKALGRDFRVCRDGRVVTRDQFDAEDHALALQNMGPAIE